MANQLDQLLGAKKTQQQQSVIVGEVAPKSPNKWGAPKVAGAIEKMIENIKQRLLAQPSLQPIFFVDDAVLGEPILREKWHAVTRTCQNKRTLLVKCVINTRILVWTKWPRILYF